LNLRPPGRAVNKIVLFQIIGGSHHVGLALDLNPLDKAAAGDNLVGTRLDPHAVDPAFAFGLDQLPLFLDNQLNPKTGK